jgi:hypothetical protein
MFEPRATWMQVEALALEQILLTIKRHYPACYTAVEFCDEIDIVIANHFF